MHEIVSVILHLPSGSDEFVLIWGNSGLFLFYFCPFLSIQHKKQLQF